MPHVIPTFWGQTFGITRVNAQPFIQYSISGNWQPSTWRLHHQTRQLYASLKLLQLPEKHILILSWNLLSWSLYPLVLYPLVLSLPLKKERVAWSCPDRSALLKVGSSQPSRESSPLTTWPHGILQSFSGWLLKLSTFLTMLYGTCSTYWWIPTVVVPKPTHRDPGWTTPHPESNGPGCLCPRATLPLMPQSLDFC